MEANDKARLLREIQLCTFLLTEANLYLDTHPDDQDALKFYEKHAARLRELRTQYEEQFGRIEKRPDGTLHWAWTDKPWPWQKEV